MNWVTGVPWVYPALEAVHVVGIAVLIGSLVVFEVRVWGLGRAVELRALARLALPLSLGGFALALASGALMFFSQVDEMLGNAAFLVKMGVLVAAGVNAAAFHVRGGIAVDDGVARAQTVLSLGLWLVVVFCGRWIAYK